MPPGADREPIGRLALQLAEELKAIIAAPLGGDLSGFLPNPQVIDLTLTAEEQGTVTYFDGSNWVVLLPGAAGQALITQGVGGDPIWGSAGAGGPAGGDLGDNYPNPTVKDLTFTSEAQGTIAYFNGSNWVVLAVGAAGQLLQTNGAGVDPSWVTPAAGGSGWTDAGAGFVRLVSASDNVVIGTSAPVGKLRVFGGAFSADGTTGSYGLTGAGTRMFWSPAEAAFRAGVVTGTQWNVGSRGAGSFAVNQDTTASGPRSSALGTSTLASGIDAHATGVGTVATGNESHASGDRSRAFRPGQRAHANGQFATPGDVQWGDIVLRGTTTDATPTPLSTDGAAIVLATAMVLEDGKAYIFEAYVGGSSTVADEVGGYVFMGVIKRVAGAASVTFVGGVDKTVLGEDVMAWDVNAVANITLGSLDMVVEGVGGPIQWGTTIKWTEVSA